jgi:hypothetical protein
MGHADGRMRPLVVPMSTRLASPPQRPADRPPTVRSGQVRYASSFSVIGLGRDNREPHEGKSRMRDADRIGKGTLLLSAIIGVLAVTNILEGPYPGLVAFVLLYVGIVVQGVARRFARRSDAGNTSRA